MAPKIAQFEDWEDALFTAMGRLVISYNQAEGGMRSLLSWVVGYGSHEDDIRAVILTSELGSVGLESALKSFANDLMEAEAGAVTLNVIAYMERIRAYRNFYVHGITMALPRSLKIPETHGMVLAFSAKAKSAEHFAEVTLEQIDSVTDWCATLSAQIRAILKHLAWNDRDAPTFAQTPLPDTLPLPPPLTKPRLDLRELLPRHGA